MSLPHADVLTEIYDRLDAQLSVDVRFAGSGGTAPAKYVALQMPSAERRDTFTTRGYDHTVTVRCHTEHAAGQARPLRAMQLAEDAKAALEGWQMDISPDHAALYLSSPSVTENSYAMDDSRRALDYVLTYTLKTQDLTA